MKSLPRFELSQSELARTTSDAGQASSIPDLVEELESIPSDGDRPSVGGPSWSGFPMQTEDELVGATLNDTYVVESVLGEGGMGRVYRAQHTRIHNKQFAVKVLRRELAHSAELIARFRREAQAAACISHPNVVGVYDIDQTPDGYVYIVCEHLVGEDLGGRMASRAPLAVKTAVHIAAQVASALSAAHAAGVIHRDIKPHNVFLLYDEQGVVPELPAAKVLDFGLSRFMDADGAPLTRAGVVMGTPAYMSPEQASGRDVDFRTDVYGLGAVLYVALTGRPPIEGDSLQAVLLAVINQEPPRPRLHNPQIPESLELVIQRAMAIEPEHRYQTMGEFREALLAFLEPSPRDAEAGSPRAGFVTRTKLEAESHEVATARPRLILVSVLFFSFLVVGLATTVPSFELLWGRLELTRVEAALLGFAVLGTLLTPTFLLLRRIRRTVWYHHARVLELLDLLSRGVMSALLAYGLGALAIRFVDLWSRFGLARSEPSPLAPMGIMGGAYFPGFNLILLVLALLVGATTLWARRLELRDAGTRVTRWLLVLSGWLAALAALTLGFSWRAAHQERMLDQATQGLNRPVPASIASQAPGPSPLTKPVTLPEKPALASGDELARASAKGVEGLLPLSERYPKDPNVLHPLVLAFASRATGLADAMAIAQRLFDAAPERAYDPDLRFLVRKAAVTPGQASKLALGAMADHMGSAGPDLLYDLWVNQPKVAKRAAAFLTQPRVRAKASPALKVALELRDATSCADRLPLLQRAAELGDNRAAALLSPLTISPRRGCGRSRREACPPPCPEEAGAIRASIARIMSRGQGTKP